MRPELPRLLHWRRAGEFEGTPDGGGVRGGTVIPASGQDRKGIVHRGVESHEGGRFKCGRKQLVVTPAGMAFVEMNLFL